jgi:3-deoxy-D-manno-octulosonate 8-phosphate phosphatase (KDO 8-P phosphatase)
MRHRGLIPDATTPDPISAFCFPLSAFQKIKLLALDFDGVLTDNRVLITEEGKEAVLCNRGDGLGLGMLKQAGIEVVVISKEKNPVVAARCRKLGLECVQACDNKLAALKKGAEGGSLKTETRDEGGKLKTERGPERSQASSFKFHPSPLSPEEIAYVGNDVNDLECMKWVGWPIAVNDAVPEVIAVAKYITKARGGYGAVREICDLLLAQQTK